MPYNHRQYRPIEAFELEGDDNITNPQDLKRIQAYNFYEDLYQNAVVSLQLVLRGDDQSPMLMPTPRKVIETTNRFLAPKISYFVDAGGDEGTRELVEEYWRNFYAREAFPAKLESSKVWGLTRGDAVLYIYSRPEKELGSRLCVEEIDPRQVFEIEDPQYPQDIVGYHIVEKVQDWREPDKPDKKIAKRRTFRRIFDASAKPIGVTSELRFFEIGKWDDRKVDAEIEEVTTGADEHGRQEEEQLPETIIQLPIYKWRNRPPQNSSWGTSQLEGFETLFYGLNQSLTDEDATLVFQGLGMYVTTAGPPRDPNDPTQITPWNIGPKQVIEVGQDQRFDRVTGVSDVSPFTQHMETIEKSITESAGTPEIAIGRVDVSIAESGIALQMQMMPLLAQNATKELEIVTALDHFHHDLTTQWLPAYESESFGNAGIMSEISVVTVFDDPMPKNRDTKIQEIVLLDQANLILKTMTIQELRDLGYKYPTVDQNGNPLSDEDIAQMLLDQQTALTAALDPFAAAGAAGGTGEQTDQFGNPISNTPDEQSIDLGVTG